MAVGISTFKRVSASIIPVGIASFFVHVSSAEVQIATINEVPSGQELFTKHCSQCHGTGGKGDGPLVSSLKVAPADLTRISQRAGGIFPASRIAEIIRYGGDVEAHGPRDMPVWGKVFSDAGGHGKIGGAYSRRAVVELKEYLESIQQAP
jgi:mono/diheme cytochrome c family protein